MKPTTPFISLTALIAAAFSVFSSTALAQWEAPAGYYSSATGTGSTLQSQIQSIMSTGHILRSYGDFRYMARYTDQDPNNSSNILLAYNRASVSYVWDSGSTWNREHVWPQSLQPGSASNSTTGALADPHSLRPVNPSINSSRGNKPFGLSTTTGSYGSLGTYYFPGDADKGDIARALFYQDTRWGPSQGLSLVNGVPGSNQMGDLASLLAWNYLDTPDEFEQRRNHVVYSSAENPSYYTNNRNAFVDHPEYVWSIYVDQQNDSGITINGGAAGAGGSSTLDVDFGAVIVGASAPASQSVTIDKAGFDGTYYSVTTTGGFESSNEGRYNAFAINTSGSDSATFSVGAGSGLSTATAGPITGQVTIDNLDVTTAGVGDVGANDGDDVVSLALDVLDHATPSFASGAATVTLTHDFGSVPVGGSPTFNFDLFNLEATAGYTAGLDLDSIFGAGDTSVLSTDLAAFSDLSAGASSGFTASFNAAVPGAYSSTYTLSLSDEDLAGAINLPSLTLNLVGTVTGAGLLGDVDLDGDIDADDIDALYANLGDSDPLYDIGLNGGAADQSDVDALVRDVLMTEYGDANLDLKVDASDVSTLSASFNGAGGWAAGDFSGDGAIGSSDVSTLSAFFNFDNSGGASAIVTAGAAPEPASIGLLVVASLLAAGRRRPARA